MNHHPAGENELTWIFRRCAGWPSVDEDDTLMPLHVARDPRVSPDRAGANFDNLCSAATFVALMKGTLSTTRYALRSASRIGIAATPAPNGRPVTLHLLQCRPQSALREETTLPVPDRLENRRIASSSPRGWCRRPISNIDYLIYVSLALRQKYRITAAGKSRTRSGGQQSWRIKNFIMLGRPLGSANLSWRAGRCHITIRAR